MSYAQAMRWSRKHPKGGKAQYMGFSAGSGFWPSSSWTEKEHGPYIEACQKIGCAPLKGEVFYRFTLRGRIMSEMTAENRAHYTMIMTVRAQAEGVSVERCIAGTP